VAVEDSPPHAGGTSGGSIRLRASIQTAAIARAKARRRERAGPEAHEPKMLLPMRPSMIFAMILHRVAEIPPRPVKNYGNRVAAAFVPAAQN
jgi:hypothetical protein